MSQEIIKLEFFFGGDLLFSKIPFDSYSALNFFQLDLGSKTQVANYDALEMSFKQVEPRAPSTLILPEDGNKNCPTFCEWAWLPRFLDSLTPYKKEDLTYGEWRLYS